MKNNGDNLVLGCDDSKCKEWPKVGDEVLLYDRPCMVIGIDGDAFWIKKESGRYDIASRHQLQKPKTPEEELRELLHLLWDENCGDFDDFVDIAIRHVTKKPQ